MIRTLSVVLLPLLSGLCFGTVSPAAAKDSAQPARGKILFVRKSGATFETVTLAMKKDLGANYVFSEYVIAKDTSYSDFKTKVRMEDAALTILMDNQALNFLKRYNEEESAPVSKRKGLALLGLNLKTELKGNKDIAGIAFETPAYSLVTQFRYVSTRALKNVLVFYRKSLFSEAVQAAADQLKPEGVTLTAIDVEAFGREPDSIESFLAANIQKYVTDNSRFDAVWILLDSAVLSQKVFASTWIPSARTSKIPFITGVENLVSTELNFGIFAITPNLQDLAGQAAQLVDSIVKDHAKPSEIGCEEPIGVNKIINLKRARDLGLPLQTDRLSEVKILE